MTQQSSFKQRFIDLALASNALRFGEFTLKSGRVSPYFFNAGAFNSGAALAVLGECYADAIEAAKIDFDVIFGPAYKGIPLAAVTAAALHQKYGRDKPYSFNRKEKKDHGEGGRFVGAPVEGMRMLVVDDVVTAGTAVGEVATLLDEADAKMVAVLVGLDRDERAKDTDQSALQQLAEKYYVQTASIVSLLDIRDYISNQLGDKMLISKIDEYRKIYGVQS